MSSFGDLLPGLGVHLILQKQEFVAEMLNGIIQRSSPFPSEGERPCYAYSSQSVQTVRVLDYLPFSRLRSLSPVLAE